MNEDTLFHVGNPITGTDLEREVTSDQDAYGKVMHHTTVYDALIALKAMSKRDLQSIKTFLLDERLNSVPVNADAAVIFITR